MIKPIKKIIHNTTVPRTGGVPLTIVVKLFFLGLKDGILAMRASSIAYNFFLAIFPTILFFFSIIPYIPIQNFDVLLMDALKNFMPSYAYETIRSTVEDIVSRQHGGVLSIGFFMTLYFSTNGINSIIEAFNKTSHAIETRSWVKQRLIAILLMLIISALIIISITLISLNNYFVKWLVSLGFLKGSFVYHLIISVKYLILLSLVYFTYSFMYFLGPSKKQSFRFFSYGSTIATILTALSVVGFNFYINNFSKYNALYGSIGTLIIVLMWIYLIALVTILGFEINVSIMRSKSQKRIDKYRQFIKED